MSINNTACRVVKNYLKTFNYEKDNGYEVIDFPFPDGDGYDDDIVYISVTPYEVNSGWFNVSNKTECGVGTGNHFMNIAVRGTKKQSAYEVKVIADEIKRLMVAVNTSSLLNFESDGTPLTDKVSINRINVRGSSNKRSYDKNLRHVYYFNIEIIYTEFFEDIIKLNLERRF